MEDGRHWLQRLPSDYSRFLMARSIIPTSAWSRRLTYELIYLSFGTERSGMFNVGFSPVHPDIPANPAFALRPSQIQLYAEMFSQIPWSAEEWRLSECFELAAGCGGGLLYLNANYSPRSATGIEQSYVAAWRARRLGVDVRQGDAARLFQKDKTFDCVYWAEALALFSEAGLREAFRVLKPGGYLLFGEVFRGTPEAAREYFRRIGSAAGFDFCACRDATAGVQRSLLERSKMTPFGLQFPRFIRERLKETFSLEGSERLRLWQSGAMSFVFVTFRSPM